MKTAPQKDETIGIIAASGEMPLEVAETLISQGKDVFIIALKGIATADFSAFEHTDLHIGKLGKIIDTFIDAGCAQIVLVGKMTRPSFFDVKPDLRGAKIFTKVMSSSDDSALKIIEDEFAKDDIHFRDIGTIMPKIYADHGQICGTPPQAEARDAIALGIDILKAIGSFDMGQGCVVQGGRILALEGAEGTDSMLKRSSDLILEGGSDAVFIKMLKTDQDPALDPPGFGADTVINAANAGIRHIALQAGGVIMINKEKTIAEAEARKISILGFTLE